MSDGPKTESLPFRHVQGNHIIYINPTLNRKWDSILFQNINKTCLTCYLNSIFKLDSCVKCCFVFVEHNKNPTLKLFLASDLNMVELFLLNQTDTIRVETQIFRFYSVHVFIFFLTLIGLATNSTCIFRIVL